MHFIRPERLLLRTHPQLDEKWVHARIAEDPGLLGLGDVVLRDKERPQPHAGRLDLLLQDAESAHRYEVEVQLGATDETHIVRTLEYWDIERKRYPQYDHTAVIVAEEITGRFLNVISLFNGSIPLMALQMTALRIGEGVTLVFTTVLDVLERGLVDEDEELAEVTDRPYWDARASKDVMKLADQLLDLLQAHDPKLELKYNKFFVGLARDGRADNFVAFTPRKRFLVVEAKVPRTDELDKALDEAGVDVVTYDPRWHAYRIRMAPADLPKHKDVITELFSSAYKNRHAE